MKRFLACFVALVMSVFMLAACSGADSGLTNAKEYLNAMYRDAAQNTPMDFIRVGVVRIEGVSYGIEWSADSELVTFEYDEATKMVTVKINNTNTEDVNYTLTATMTNEKGDTETATFAHCIPAVQTYEDIVKDAYTLEAGDTMDGTYRLEGVITKIDTAWSDEYKNITVTIQVGDLADMPIMCYRLAGEGAESLAVTDTITVTGMIKNYNGTIEFDKGCLLEKVVKGEGIPESELPAAPDESLDMNDISAVLDTAFAMADGEVFTNAVTLTGKITEIKTPWSDQYQNISVIIAVEGEEDHPVLCFRLKGEGAEALAVGDVITTTGLFKNYQGTIELDAGCTLDAVVKGDGETSTETPDETPVDSPVPATLAEQIAAANKLANGEFLTYESTITGVITDDPYESSRTVGAYKFTVSDGTNSLLCYYVPVTGGTPKKGDTVTVTGKLSAYNGAAQFADSNSSATWISAGAADETEKPASNDPAADSTLSVADAVALGASKAHNTYTEGKYYVTGVITEVYNTEYGNMKITDEAGNILTIYGTYSADGTIRYDALEIKPVVGDTVTIYGIIGQYKDSPQIKNGWITAHTPAGN